VTARTAGARQLRVGYPARSPGSGPSCVNVVTAHPVVGSRRWPGRTSAPVARSASGWAAYGRRGACMSTHPYLRATSRAPCCGGMRPRSPEPSMPCSRASNSHRPDLVVSIDYSLSGLCWPTQHVPLPVPRATGRKSPGMERLRIDRPASAPDTAGQRLSVASVAGAGQGPSGGATPPTAGAFCMKGMGDIF